nr:MobC family plasmid mobilization relaxosome protein [Methylosinus sp. PW1]
MRKAAASLGIGPATFAAEAVRAAIGTKRVRPLPKNRGEVAEAVREATGEIGRVGNNVNQLARVANSGGRVDAAALAPILASLAAIDAKLSELARLS